MKSINPKNNELIKEYQEASADEVSSIIKNTHQSFITWSAKSFDDRAKLFHKLSEVLLKNTQKFSRLMTDEMGKPIDQAIKEVEKCAWVCRYYADNAEDFLKSEVIESDHDYSEVVFKPIGVVLAVMPWNFPFWQVLRFAAPTLMAGNTAVLKHASNVPGCALAIEEAFLEAGFDKGVFSTLLIGSSKVEAVIENPLVQAVSLTGSTQAGKKVAQTAGVNVKKSVLELGGSDPYVILEDANIKEAARECVKSRMLNNGQSCIGAKRFIAVDSIYDEFKEHFVSFMKEYSTGDPADKSCKLGPMAKVDLRDELHDQVSKCKEMGARIILGGVIENKDNAYYSPCIIENITKEMPAYSEEFFGPVASLFKASDLDEALTIANDTSFGLGSGVFTSNKELGLKIAREKLISGASFVNTFVSSDPRLPFGGTKQSGYGRELSRDGILEFVNTKTICFNKI